MSGWIGRRLASATIGSACTLWVLFARTPARLPAIPQPRLGGGQRDQRHQQPPLLAAVGPVRNASVLQMFHLHPDGKGKGIAGHGAAVSILIAQSGQEELYPNQVLVDRNRGCIKVRYGISLKGFPLLLQSMTERLQVRGFLSPSHPARQLFCGDKAAVLFLPLLNIKKLKTESNRKICILEAPLLQSDMCVIK